MAFMCNVKIWRKLNLANSFKQLIVPGIRTVVYNRALKFKESYSADTKFGIHSYPLMMQRAQRSFTNSKDLQYEDLVRLKNKDNVVLIDVRENNEIQETGKLPGSIHISLGELKTALESTPPEIFKDRYGVKKPDPEMTICFSCRSGKRSKIALDIALGLGYSNACHYEGGFLDWQKHNPS